MSTSTMTPKKRSERVTLHVIFGIALILAITMAWLPVDWTIGRFIYDDMFYYLRVAEQNGDQREEPQPSWLFKVKRNGDRWNHHASRVGDSAPTKPILHFDNLNSGVE